MLRLLFSLSGVVSRQQYLVAGVTLMVLKYALDAGAVFVASGEIFTPVHYVNPSLGAREAVLRGSNDALVLAMIAWSLPFMWIGVSMTMRRARDAGLSPWIALLFFVPIVNWILALALSVLPAARGGGPQPQHHDEQASGFASALTGIAVSVAIAAVMIPLAVYGKGNYGMSLFVGTPFVQGFVTGHLYNRRRRASIGSNLGVITAGVALVAGAILLLALEGAICILMALPLAWIAAAMGMLVGRSVASARHSSVGTASSVIALPLLTVAEPAGPREVFEVVSSVEIDAPPAVVWNHLVAVGELPPPHERIFAVGIAYPQRAVIDGEGVGAIRRCEFSTGAFVEPITAWDAPHRLAFDVAEQPPPMHEWSPYRHVHPPHLDGYFRSVRGEFRLVETATGTRLEGSTWYELDILPRAYWGAWADMVIGSIHDRVLAHIAATAESASDASP